MNFKIGLVLMYILFTVYGCHNLKHEDVDPEYLTVYKGEVPENFSSFSKLKKVRFESNSFGMLLFSSFEKLPIRYFSFTDGNLTGFDCKYFKTLDTLILSRNKIDIVININKNTDLKYIDLSGNRIQKFDFDVFEDNQYISYIDLSFNFLKKFPCPETEDYTIKKYNLSTNRIAEIPYEICNFTVLEELDISNNLISSFPEEFYSLKNLRVLNIGRNNFNKIEIDILQSKMPLLKIVY